jgi:predicted nucleotidyltransferase
MPSADPAVVERVGMVARGQSGLELLLLFGSRARGDASERSDWDFGYVARPDFDPLELSARLVEVLGTDRVDLADLNRAGALVRFRAARDGLVVFAANDEAYPRFWLDAVSFWCDAGPSLRRATRASLPGCLGERS